MSRKRKWISFIWLIFLDVNIVSQISGLAQSFGYFLASVGPVLFGFIRDATGGWFLPLTLLIVIDVAMLFSGLGVAQEKKIG